MLLFLQSLNNNYIGVQASAYKNDFLFTEVWTPFFLWSKGRPDVAFPMSFSLFEGQKGSK